MGFLVSFEVISPAKRHGTVQLGTTMRLRRDMNRLYMAHQFAFATKDGDTTAACPFAPKGAFEIGWTLDGRITVRSVVSNRIPAIAKAVKRW
jgi:hypothetical protein